MIYHIIVLHGGSRYIGVRDAFLARAGLACVLDMACIGICEHFRPRCVDCTTFPERYVWQRLQLVSVAEVAEAEVVAEVATYKPTSAALSVRVRSVRLGSDSFWWCPRYVGYIHANM
jgi:hypothetical protein